MDCTDFKSSKDIYSNNAHDQELKRIHGLFEIVKNTEY
jgi:hypothetical protein